jgi:adenosylcobalamin-dependent ribonucleoside-triphosphate reductase
MIVDVDRFGTFGLDEAFLDAYRDRPVEWGFGPLSWVTYQRTYSRDGERWWQTCRRVIEGMFTILRCHCLAQGLPWEHEHAVQQARQAYDRLWQFKWTPPGRGLWMMGTRFVYERGGAALNNCGFVSTAQLAADYAGPFLWMLRMSMLGVGVGFDTRGRGTVAIRRPRRAAEPFVVEDSREGWVAALERLLRGYTSDQPLPACWDFSRIRPAGAPLASFGGISAGKGPLQEMLETLHRLYDAAEGQKAESPLIVDTMNVVGRCVVAGGIRRSAQIAFGDPDDQAFLDLKQDPRKLREYRWVSNNSVLAQVGMDYSEAARRTAVNGEPGFFWLQNARAHGRMKDPPDGADAGAAGSNPCVEQTLWDRELCCLVETYPARHENPEDYLRTLRLAYLYAKTVTLVPTEDSATNLVMSRNRRIGCSMTGIVQAIHRLGCRQFLEWCDQGYQYLRRLDARYSGWIHVPRSIKLTSVKPSGTVSLLAGATPGVHWDHAPTYIRRLRIAPAHPLADMCRRAGYPVEEDHYAPNTLVVSFPVRVRDLGRRKADVPLREKVDLAAQMQRCWSDNQVSCTADFDPRTEGPHLADILKAYEGRLKAISFLPARQHGYPQPPYEEISAQQYEQMVAGLKPLRGGLEHEHELEAQFCEGGPCQLEL